MAIKVLLSADSALLRKAIVHLLLQEPKIRLVGEASDFAQTITLASELKPNVVILDLHMPNVAGVTALRVRTSLASCTDCILAISLRNDEETQTLAEDFGAACLLDKMELAQKLIPAVIKASSAYKSFHKRASTAAGAAVPPCEA